MTTFKHNAKPALAETAFVGAGCMGIHGAYLGARKVIIPGPSKMNLTDTAEATAGLGKWIFPAQRPNIEKLMDDITNKKEL